MIRWMLALALLCAPLVGWTQTGPVRVVDGDTVVMSGERIRLFGINAPEASQRCDNGRWSCGAAATDALVALVGNRHLACVARDTDRYGRTVAVCRNAAGQDVAAALVAQGLATAYRRYSMDYVPAEDAARAAGLGVWSGQFQDPEAYRHGRVPEAAGSAASKALAGARKMLGQLAAAGAAPAAGGAFPREGYGYNNLDGTNGPQPAAAAPAPARAPSAGPHPSGLSPEAACALTRMAGRTCN